MAREVGRPLNVKTAEELWELFEAYAKATKEKPILKHVFVGKDGVSDNEKRERPLTYEGFKNYCRRKKIGEVHQYFDNQEAYPQFLDVCRAIKDEIRQDQIEGGMAMIYHPSITQRLNGLHETVNNNVTSVPILNIDPLADGEKK